MARTWKLSSALLHFSVSTQDGVRHGNWAYPLNKIKTFTASHQKWLHRRNAKIIVSVDQIISLMQAAVMRRGAHEPTSQCCQIGACPPKRRTELCWFSLRWPCIMLCLGWKLQIISGNPASSVYPCDYSAKVRCTVIHFHYFSHIPQI